MPAKVDFYVLSGDGERIAAEFACRLTEKAYKLSHTVHVHMANADRADRMNEFLWTFRDGSFVPHELHGQTAAGSPVTIGTALNVPEQADLFINLTSDMPPFPDRFTRIAEIVDANPARKRASRERFKTYRSNGHELDTHTID